MTAANMGNTEHETSNQQDFIKKKTENTTASPKTHIYNSLCLEISNVEKHSTRYQTCPGTRGIQ